MNQEFLSFNSIGGSSTSEWSATAKDLSQRFADVFTAHGFEIDFEVCRYPGMQDWEFLARGHAVNLLSFSCYVDFNRIVGGFYCETFTITLSQRIGKRKRWLIRSLNQRSKPGQTSRM